MNVVSVMQPEDGDQAMIIRLSLRQVCIVAKYPSRNSTSISTDLSMSNSELISESSRDMTRDVSETYPSDLLGDFVHGFRSENAHSRD